MSHSHSPAREVRRAAKVRADYGTTPVLDGSAVAPEPRKPSMQERIKAATSVDELKVLAKECDTYKHASQKTVRRWERVMHNRVIDLKKAALTKGQ